MYSSGLINSTPSSSKDLNSSSMFQQRSPSPFSGTSFTPLLWKTASSKRQLIDMNHSVCSLSASSSKGFQAGTTTPPSHFYGSTYTDHPISSLNPSPQPSQSSSRGLGYFAFSPIARLPGQAPIKKPPIPDEHSPAQSQESQKEDLQGEKETNEGSKRMEAESVRRAQLEAEARRGEEAWVQSGGVLRDARGTRDMQRTEAVRAELKLRDWEAKVSMRWKRYESGWKAMLAEGERIITFHDIPWPVHVPREGKEVQEDKYGIKLGDVTSERIETFFLEPLKVRGCTVTRKERIRSALLRWHPDKMTGVLGRVASEDGEAVRAGIRVVIECLQRLNIKIEMPGAA